ncbi:hypothetical protein C943_00872 [Mariniradius saccharolyticus AK6]|uniref:Uncharacterized protein n=1 Tax=Mariniradius saccharolyticus AK6 TaxID=1239962 RepID=M7Y6M3_9BACT|nr:hypothetical protein C943_00872 [Mariniradius saccharolyticus AK6]
MGTNSSENVRPIKTKPKQNLTKQKMNVVDVNILCPKF